MNGHWQQIEEQLSQALGEFIQIDNISSIGGGCINQAWKAQDKQDNSWFIKTNHAGLHDMFMTEFQGLQEIHASQTIKTPEPILHGIAGQEAFLIMEYLPLSGRGNVQQAGQQLAQMHQTIEKNFGFYTDNYIGSTPQSNQQHHNWIDFWREERLIWQLDLARKNGITKSTYDKGLILADSLQTFFTDYQPQASLLHGDLWGGNMAYTEHSEPVIFDPAVYYGDRETDLAMTELFGGFSQHFYAAYNEAFPIDAGYKTRKTLYNLYHILNHFNLFGGGYATQADSMIQRLLAET